MRRLAVIAAVLGWACAGVPKPVSGPAVKIAFIEEDFPRALGLAKQRHTPLFVDGSAQWCWTCRYLREYVFTDPSLADDAQRFTWLSLDIDRESSGEFLKKFPIDDLPALIVVDPDTGSALLRWTGLISVPQLRALLEDSETLWKGAGGSATLDQQVLEAERLAASGANAAAVERLDALLAAAPKAWSDRPRVIRDLLLALRFSRQFERCATQAPALLVGAPAGRWLGGALTVALECWELGADDAAWRKQSAPALLTMAERVVGQAGMSADDRFQIYDGIVSLLSAGEDAAQRAVWGKRWLEEVEAQAEQAPSAEARAAFNWSRLSAARACGEEARVLPALERTEHEMPRDWDASSRLADAYEGLGRYEDALAANERALRLAGGVSSLGLLEREARLQERTGSVAGALKALRRALALSDGLPAALRPEHQISRLKERLRSLQAASGKP